MRVHRTAKDVHEHPERKKKANPLRVRRFVSIKKLGLAPDDNYTSTAHECVRFVGKRAANAVSFVFIVRDGP